MSNNPIKEIRRSGQLDCKDKVISLIEGFEFPFIANSDYHAGFWAGTFGRSVTGEFYKRKRTLLSEVIRVFEEDF